MVVNTPPSYPALQRSTALEVIENRLAQLSTIWGDPDLAAVLQERVAERAASLLDQLQDDDFHVARQAGDEVQRLCFGMSAPTSTWFGTPLGLLVFHALYRTEEAQAAAGALSRAEAAELLGVSRQRVHAMIKSRQLQPDPDGGVAKASVGELLRAREGAKVAALLKGAPSARGTKLDPSPKRGEEVVRVQALGPNVDVERITRWVLANGGRLAVSTEPEEAHAKPEFASREFLLVPLVALGLGALRYDAD